MPPGAVLVTPEDSIRCIWELLAMGLSKASGKELAVQDLRGVIARGYRVLGDGDAAKAMQTWKAEGKGAFAKQAQSPTGPILSSVSQQAEYYPSNIDLFFLSVAYDTTLAIVSSAVNKQTGTEFIVYGPRVMQEGRVLMLKRGKQAHNKPIMYTVVASPGSLTLVSTPAALRTAIADSHLPDPYHSPAKRVVVVQS